MSTAAERRLVPFTELAQLREAREILQQEAAALGDVSRRLDRSFCEAVSLMDGCGGSVIVTGMGKAGLIGRKIAATLSSTGTQSHVLHPAEALHGDLGCLHTRDLLLALSNSGETDEICRLLPIVRGMGVPVIAITATQESTLGSGADVTLCLGRLHEADVNGLAPTTSTTAMLAVGDALALVLSRLNGLTSRQFAVYHPGGSLGRQLKTVRDIMRQEAELRIATCQQTVREVFVNLETPGRRTGAVMLVDDDGVLAGLFTDSDLVRLLEQRRESQLDRPIAEVMTPDPLRIRAETLLTTAVELLSERKVSELPVVDEREHPIGLIDITDLIGWMPAETMD